MNKIHELIEKIDSVNAKILNEQDLSLLVEEISLKSDEVLKEMLKSIEEREND
jgi:chorismate mutase